MTTATDDPPRREASEARLALDLIRARREGAAGLALRQQRRLAALVQHARSASRLYRRHFGDCAPDAPLRDLPPITKLMLMDAFDDWVTDPLITRAGIEAFVAQPTLIGSPYLDTYFVCSTSGVTGHPGRFVHDRRAIAVYRALTVRLMLDWLSAGDVLALVRRGLRWVSLVGTGGHFAGEGWFEMERRRDVVRRRGYHVLSVQRPLGEIVAALNTIDPAGLTVYPSALALLTEERVAGRLKIRPVFIELGGESMDPGARAHAARVFACPVHDTYSCSEALTMAYGCAHGSLHVNSDWMILEPVDEDLRPTPPGKASHTVLLTNLANRVAPIIRYDLGDSVLARAEPCPCGSVLAAIQVAGRRSDVVRLVAGGRTVKIPPSALGVTLAKVAGARRIQLVQSAPGTLRVRLQTMPGADIERTWSDAIAKLHAYLADQGLGSVELVRTSELPKQSATSGKFRQIISLRENDGRSEAPS